MRALMLSMTTAIALLGAGYAHAQYSDEKIKIGVLTDMSGQYAANSGSGSVEAARIAIDEFGGKVNGKPIELVVGDHQNKADVGVSITNKWFDVEQVDAVADLVNSSVALAVQDIAKRKGKVTLISGGGTVDLTGKACSPTGVHWTYDSYALGKGIAEALPQLGKKWFFITADYAFGHAILDWSHINTTPEHTDAVIEALRDSHIRAVYGYGPNFFHPDPATNPYPGDIYRLRTDYFSSPDQLLTLALAAAGPQFGNVPFAVIEWNIAREVGARISVHVGVGADGPTLVQQLHQALTDGGYPGLGPDTTYIHSCTLTDEEFDLIRDTRGFLSRAIPVEMQMGHGEPPIQRALDRHIPFSLSVDVETNQPTDMFTQMHACFALQRALKNEEHLFTFGDFSDSTALEAHRLKLLTVRGVLELATIGGARANGLDHKIGTLTPGKEADIILLDTKQINMAPINNATGAVVLGMECCNVDSVFIAGKPVKWKGGWWTSTWKDSWIGHRASTTP